MVITGEEELKSEEKMVEVIPPLSVELKSYGFPHGYFMLRCIGAARILDVARGSIEDGTDVILWPPTDSSQVESMRRPESNNQVFFIDTSGALSSRHSGHAIDVEKEKLVLRHRRPVSHPFPNAYSHPLPRFVYHPETKEITVVFGTGLSDLASRRSSSSSTRKEKTYYLTSVPVRRPPSLMANASNMLNTAIAGPLAFFGGKGASNATPEQVFDGEIDLTENEIAEQDRNEAEEIDDSIDALRPVKVIALTAEEAENASEQAKLRRQWEVLPLRISKHRTGMPSQLLPLVLLAVLASSQTAWCHRHGHHNHDQVPLADLNDFTKSNGEGSTWLEKYGKQIDQPFTGPLSFSHLPYSRCLEDESAEFDIAVLGMPFDTAVTYRPGARFGPYAIRSGSRRQRETRGYTLSWHNNPYELGSKIMDCGDVPVSPFDNALAVDQMEVAYSTLLARSVASNDTTGSSAVTQRFAKDGKQHPRIVSTDQSRVTHGTFFYLANEEGLMTNTSIHAGIRCKLTGMADIDNDASVGFQLISTDDIDDYGVAAIIKRIRDRVGDSPVYLSLDIDVIDPGLAPATGTPEAGGWTTREVKRIIRGLAGLNFVGADIVEVSPAYDNAEITGIAAADIVHDFLSMLLSSAPPAPHSMWGPARDEL
ncbi:hypothetical protein NUW54_g2324 [Trametes sanguinea]|uniref:Uncharacterized protein n=1 Tax=Trametes sanguinea TaxID=158606 RepID=A0ACC1Q5N0_9APHY|nr:hypothetical protein NUW54_g2324 [Trametes sanguinea]